MSILFPSLRTEDGRFNIQEFESRVVIDAQLKEGYHEVIFRRRD